HDLRNLSDKTSFDMKDLSEKTSYDIKHLSNKIDNLQNRMWSNFLWLMGMIMGLAGLIAHTQDWI
ncbi:MAG: hypothetical protein JO131_00560, partial [Gammaproteobacteria bacterium]|nr:hypothetical protein [Gammaproteobacteria bacterium]